MALGDVNQDVSGRRAYYEKARTLATDLYNEDQAQRLAAAEVHESQAKKDLDETLKALGELNRRAPK
jgi:hypothetical protein